MDFNQILESTHQLSEAELKELNLFICSRLKDRRSFDAALKRRTLAAGDRVSWSGRRGHTEGTIVRVKRKKAICDIGNGQNWDVPLNMLTKVG